MLRLSSGEWSGGWGLGVIFRMRLFPTLMMTIGLTMASLPAQPAATVKCLIGGRELDYHAISEMQLDAIGQFGMLRLWDAAGTDTGSQEAAKSSNPRLDLGKPDHVVILSPPNACSEDGNIRVHAVSDKSDLP